MVKKVYSIKDNKSGVFGYPIVGDNISIRRYLLVRANKDDIISQFPDDFSCYEVGTFDDETGYIAACVPKLFLNLSDCVRKVEEAD